jgi:hypothetical protein
MMQIAKRGNIRPFEVMEAFREAATLEAQDRLGLELADAIISELG